MQNKLLRKPEGFRRLMRRAQIASEVTQGLTSDSTFALDIPAEVGIKLNNGCNLRCTHCFEWNEDGYHQSYGATQKRAELPISEIRKILDFTRASDAPLYLWGGEPLMYSKFSELAQMLAEERRWTTICTNGILIEKRMEDLIKISQDLALLISLEGLEDANDLVRGHGTFKKVLSGIQRVMELREAGSYHGSISLSLTLNDHVVETLQDFVEFFDNLGIDSIYLVFPWFVPPSVANDMDQFANDALSVQLPIMGSASWHSFTFHLSPKKLPRLRSQMEQIMQRNWAGNVRFHPHLSLEEIESFVLGSSKPAERKETCHEIGRASCRERVCMLV